MFGPTPLSDSHALVRAVHPVQHLHFHRDEGVKQDRRARAALGLGGEQVRACVGQGFEGRAHHGGWLLLVPVTHGAEEEDCLRRMQPTDIIFTSYRVPRLDSLPCPQKDLSALLHLRSGSVRRLLQCALFLESF